MKTRRLIYLIVGLTVLNPSLNIFGKNRSKEPILSKHKSNATPSDPIHSKDLASPGLKSHLDEAIKYAQENGYSTEYFFFVDMGISSGKVRFFVYDMNKDSIALVGLVAHGSCNKQSLEEPKFSNTPNCGCSSLGKYKVGPSYRGEFGKSYRLFGLESSNSNAFKRCIVLHGFDPIPDEEIYPKSLCNSFGCLMVSRSFLDKLSGIIDNLDRPVLLWVFN
jgi:L,D-transpeptidase catalytic domain